VFNDETGMWESEHTSYRSVIARFEPHLRLPSEDGKKFKSYGSCLRLMDTIPQLMKTLCVDNNWLTRVRSASLGKVLFTNGFYDFHKKEFYNYFDPQIVFMGRIHHAFEKFDEDDLTYMDDILKRIFYEPLGKEVGDYLLLNVGMGLAGDAIKMKRCLFGLGCSNAGKGVLTNAILKSFGDYAGSFNAETLAYRKSMNNEAQLMRNFMLLAFKRIIISNELKSTVELNGNMIKKIASGGDELVGRLHCGNETPFQTHFIPLILANDLPKIKPYDDAVDNRVRFITFEKTFVENPTNIFELKADNNIKSEIDEERFQKCFVGAVIRRYLKHTEEKYIEITHVEVIKAKADWTPEDSNVMEAFMNDFEMTGKDCDYVLSSRLEEWIKNRRLGISMNKFGREITKYCVVNKVEGIENKGKKLGGKNRQVWIGIRERFEDTKDTIQADIL
jgi:phage/plasmid-associated DNA primase